MKGVVGCASTGVDMGCAKFETHFLEEIYLLRGNRNEIAMGTCWKERKMVLRKDMLFCSPSIAFTYCLEMVLIFVTG